MTTIQLNKRELTRINEILAMDLFENVNRFEIAVSGSNGIGSTTTLSFDYTIDGVDGTFASVITGPEHW